MGRVLVLSGPSGVGKTTLLKRLFSSPSSDLRLLPRYTDRPRRQGEDDGFENYFVSHRDLLTKVFANDFVHIEKWGDYYSAIESSAIEDAIDSSSDAIVLTSIFGAARLRASYGQHVSSLYLWPDRRPSLLNPRCLDAASPEVVELKWRIRKKLIEGGFSEYETASLTHDAFLEKMTQHEDVPFDIRHLRRIRYQFTPRGMADFEDALKAALQALHNEA